MPFAPTDIAGLRCWQADTLSLANNDPVATWTDASASAITFTGSGGQRPTYKSSGINSLPSVEFNGTANILISSESPVWGDFTVVLVVKQLAGSPAAFARVFDKVFDTGTWIGHSGADTRTVTEYAAGVIQSSSPYGQPVDVGDNSIPHVLTSRRSGAVHLIAADGRQCVTQFSVGTTATGSSAYALGAQVGGGSYANIQLAAVFVAPSALTETQLDQLYTYLQAKYAVTCTPFSQGLKTWIQMGFWEMDHTIHREQMRVFTTDDGIALTEVPSLWRSPTSTHAARNPALIFRTSTQQYVMSHCSASLDGGWLVGANHQTFATSTDGCQTWTLLVDLDLSAFFVTVFAGSFFTDPLDGDSVHYIFAAAVSGYGVSPFLLYEIHPTNAGWTTWSDPVQITGSAFGTSPCDPQIVYINSTYFLFYDLLADLAFRLVSSTSPFSGYNTNVGLGGFATGGGDQNQVFLIGSTWMWYSDDNGVSPQRVRFRRQTGTTWYTSSMGACFEATSQEQTGIYPPTRVGGLLETPTLSGGHFGTCFAGAVR